MNEKWKLGITGTGNHTKSALRGHFLFDTALSLQLAKTGSRYTASLTESQHSPMRGVIGPAPFTAE